MRDYDKAFPKEPEQVHARVEQALRDKDARPASRRLRKPVLALAVALAALMLAGAAVAAMAYSGLLTTIFSGRGHDPELEELVQPVGFIHQSPAGEVTVSEVLFDGSSANIGFDFRLTGIPLVQIEDVRVNGEPLPMGGWNEYKWDLDDPDVFGGPRLLHLMLPGQAGAEPVTFSIDLALMAPVGEIVDVPYETELTDELIEGMYTAGQIPRHFGWVHLRKTPGVWAVQGETERRYYEDYLAQTGKAAVLMPYADYLAQYCLMRIEDRFTVEVTASPNVPVARYRLAETWKLPWDLSLAAFEVTPLSSHFQVYCRELPEEGAPSLMELMGANDLPMLDVFYQEDGSVICMEAFAFGGRTHAMPVKDDRGQMTALDIEGWAGGLEDAPDVLIMPMQVDPETDEGIPDSFIRLEKID